MIRVFRARRARPKGVETANGVARDASSCALCGAARGVEPTVALVSGGRAHVRCADREARRAWNWRQAWAWAHAIVLVATLAVAAIAGAPPLALIALALLGAALHARLHRRFWHYTIRDWRRRRR